MKQENGVLFLNHVFQTVTEWKIQTRSDEGERSNFR